MVVLSEGVGGGRRREVVKELGDENEATVGVMMY